LQLFHLTTPAQPGHHGQNALFLNPGPAGFLALRDLLEVGLAGWVAKTPSNGSWMSLCVYPLAIKMVCYGKSRFKNDK